MNTSDLCKIIGKPRVLILHGSSEISAQLRSNLHCLNDLIRSRKVINLILSPKRSIFLHASATCSELPPNVSTMGKTRCCRYPDKRYGLDFDPDPDMIV